MKIFLKSTSLLVATVLGLVACNHESLTPEGEGTIGRSDIVRFGAQAQLEAGTKATLTTEDEAMFKSAWEGGDRIGIEYRSEKGSGAVEALWKEDAFETKIAGEKGNWSYSAVYPAPAAETGTLDFGTNRYQKGNSYNSQYDLMKGRATADGADPGKTSDGKDIVFNMDRQTGIVYFHLKTMAPEVKGEKVIAATLSVEGGNIACKEVKLKSYAEGYEASGDKYNWINNFFEESTAPAAEDFRLWFNVLPTSFSKMTLHVETENHILDMRYDAKGEFAAGRLYKTVREVPADRWGAKIIVKGRTLIMDDGKDAGSKYYYENIYFEKGEEVPFSGIAAGEMNRDFFEIKDGKARFVGVSGTYKVQYFPAYNYVWLSNKDMTFPDCIYILGSGKWAAPVYDDDNTPLWGDVAYNRDAPYFVVAPKIAENTYKATMSMSTSNKDWRVLLEFYSDLNWGQNGVKPVKITGSAASRFTLNEEKGWFCGVDEKEDPFVKGNYQLIITSSADGISIDVSKFD